MRPLALVAGLLTAALVAGCGGLPTDRLVRDGTTNADGSAFSDLAVGVTAPGPTEGQTPEEVVRGFLQAQNSEAPTAVPAEGTGEVARQFLAPGATWAPLDGVIVYEGLEAPAALTVTAAQARVRVTAARRAVIDPAGSWTVAPGVVRAEFELARVAGQWRLTRVPPGLFLTTTGVRRNYRAVSAYFVAPAGGRLVPDPLHLPGPVSTLPAQLVAALLRGPSNWLAPAVASGPLPAGTRLTRPVRIRQGVVEVDLDTRARASALPDAVAAQFAWTLGQLPDVRGVRLTAAGEPLTGGDVERPEDWSGYDPDVLVTGADAYYVRDGLRLLSGPPLEGPVAGGVPALRRPAVSPAAAVVAGLVGDTTTELWTGPLAGPLARRLPADVHTPPSWGDGDAVWTVRGRPGTRQQVLAVPPAGRAEVVPLRVAGLGPLTALRVSRDGTRVALVARQRGADGATVDALHVGRVVRQRDGRRAIDGVRPVAPALRVVRDVAWRDAQVLAVLGGRLDEESVSPYLVPVDGSTAEQAVPSGRFEGQLTAIAAAPGDGTPLIMQSGDELRIKRRDVVWDRGPIGADPTYPG